MIVVSITTDESNLQKLSRKKSRFLAQSSTYLELKASNQIKKGQEVQLNYGEASNDIFLLNAGFFPKFNPNDDFVLFNDEIDAYYWWITCFGRGLSTKKRYHVMQSLIHGVSEINKQVDLETDSNRIDKIYDADTTKQSFAGKEFKIFLNTQVDCKLKVAFTLAWLAADSQLHKTDAVRLAEVSVAIRAAQALASFSTTLNDDLQMIIDEGLTADTTKLDLDKYKSLLLYYRRKQTNVSNNDCSVYEVEKLATELRFGTRMTNSKKNLHIDNRIRNITKHYNSLLYRVSKKKILFRYPI
jgi:hypothetical protein